jgi:hypothetical protein
MVPEGISMHFDTATIATTSTGSFYSSGSSKSRVLVIGAGGIGSNLAFLLATSNKYNVTLIDYDVTDEKFYDRFIFHVNKEIGIPKVEAVKAAIENAGESIRVYNNRFEDIPIKGYFIDLNPGACITFYMFSYVFITVDNLESRKYIEKVIIDNNYLFIGPKIIHVGCNLNSVSIYKTVSDLIGDDTPLIEGTSYDSVPDVKTYLRACTAALEEIDHRIELFNEFLPKSISSIPIEDAMEGWSIIDYQGTRLLGKRVQIKLRGLYRNNNLYKIKDECPYNLIFNAFLTCTYDGFFFYLFDSDGTHLKNPHTVAGNHLCLGDIHVPRKPTYNELKSIIIQIADSLEIPNLDSAVRTSFGNINLDSEFINDWCILEDENTGSQITYTFTYEAPGHIENIETELQVGILNSEEIPLGYYEPFTSEPEITGPIIGYPGLIYVTESGETVTVPIESMESISDIATTIPEDPDEPP